MLITRVILFVYDDVVQVPIGFMPCEGTEVQGRCLVLWCNIFLPVVRAECHTSLLLWVCGWQLQLYCSGEGIS